MFRNLVLILFVAAGYYYFHWQLFNYMNRIFQKEKKLGINIAFVVNYLWFIVATVLHLHLVVNWTIFFCILVVEIRVLYKSNLRSDVMMSLFGIIVGLSVTVFVRSFLALVLNKPVTVFDSRAGTAGNIKQYPVLAGFILSGVIIAFFKKRGMDVKIRQVFSDVPSLCFNVIVQSVLYIYLTLNLLAYYVPGNGIPLKIWEIKSAVFAMLGLNLSMIYTVRLSQLNLYRRKIQQDREEALVNQKEEEKTWTLAFTDFLTGCYNRYYLEEILQDYAEKMISYCLCFVDLDGLKYVNDKLGHLEGDIYLKTAVEVLQKCVRAGQDMLFRYGGDEFVLLYPDLNREQVDQRMREAQEKMKTLSRTKELPFSMSFSFGTAERWEEEDIKMLVELADKRMYQQKKEKRRQR